MPFPRPRTRTDVLEHPAYYDTRATVIDFLEHHAHQSRSTALDSVIRARTETAVM